MTIAVKVPPFPESVSKASVLGWRKNPGDAVQEGDVLAELETDKVVLEIPAPASGVLRSIARPAGSEVTSGETLAEIDPGSAAARSGAANMVSPAGATPIAPPPALATPSPSASGRVSPSERHRREAQDPPPGTATVKPELPATPGRGERRLPMSRLRARIAERLVESQRTTATLTTFNEVDMKPVMDLRSHYRERFGQEHGVKLGLMSFFVKASVAALRRFPVVNASVDGPDIVYHEGFDIGIAVSTERGLVVPILHDADRLSVAEIEKKIADYSLRAREGRISLEEITGGTFTITNGGVFGSMLSTPILNPPQSAILGMHKITDRPIALNGQVVIRPMMYLALSYDHRLVDGRDAVSFLVTVKEALEDPARLWLEV